MELVEHVYSHSKAEGTVPDLAKADTSRRWGAAGNTSSKAERSTLLKVGQVQRYRGFQNDESKVVAYDLLSTPENYVAHFERYATSVVSIIGFGRRISSIKDPIITEVIALMQAAGDVAVPAKSFPMLMETFPRKFCSAHGKSLMVVILIISSFG